MRPKPNPSHSQNALVFPTHNREEKGPSWKHPVLSKWRTVGPGSGSGGTLKAVARKGSSFSLEEIKVHEEQEEGGLIGMASVLLGCRLSLPGAPADQSSCIWDFEPQYPALPTW